MRSPPTTPHFKKMQENAVARCAMVVSVVSPERWLITVSIRGMGKTHRVKGIRECSHLVGFYQHAVGCVHFDALLDAVDLGHEDIVTADQAAVADLAVEFGKCIEIIFMEGSST